jgi:hypothetical protein
MVAHPHFFTVYVFPAFELAAPVEAAGHANVINQVVGFELASLNDIFRGQAAQTSPTQRDAKVAAGIRIAIPIPLLPVQSLVEVTCNDKRDPRVLAPESGPVL